MGLKVIWRFEAGCEGCGNPGFNSTWPDLFSEPRLRLVDNFPGQLKAVRKGAAGASIFACFPAFQTSEALQKSPVKTQLAAILSYKLNPLRKHMGYVPCMFAWQPGVISSGLHESLF